MNKVILIGNLTREPELNETGSGTSYCRFSIAVTRRFANADGEKETDFFNITAWRGQAENCYKYLQKGSKVSIIGSLQNRTYEDKGGNRRTVTDIIAEEVEFLTPKKQEDHEMREIERKPRQGSMLEEDTDDDLPF